MRFFFLESVGGGRVEWLESKQKFQVHMLCKFHKFNLEFPGVVWLSVESWAKVEGDS